MRVEDLRYFEHLAEVLNYTRASKDLDISQPTLSLAIKRLEEEWGVQLFSRNRSTVELTDIGRDISDCVTGALRSLDRARVLAEESLGTENAVINLGTIHAMQGKFWSQALFEFREKSSYDPHITVTQAYSRELLRRLRTGQLDVAFASRIEDTPDLRYNLCWSQPLVLGVNRKHPLAKQKDRFPCRFEGAGDPFLRPRIAGVPGNLRPYRGLRPRCAVLIRRRDNPFLAGGGQRIENGAVLLFADDQRIRRCGVPAGARGAGRLPQNLCGEP